MNTIQKRISGLPVKAEDLIEYVLIGQQALKAQKAKLKAITLVEKGFAAKEAALFDTQDMAEILLYAEAKLGGLIPPQEIRSSGRGTLKPSKTLPSGITKKQSHYAQELSRHEDIIAETVAKARQKGEVPVRQQVLRLVQENRRETERKEIAKKGKNAKPSEKYHIETADMTIYQTDQQFDFVITDPPYKKEYLNLYSTLAKRANEWLKNGGMLISMCGQSYLDQIYKLMSEHLEYYWTGCYLTPGQPTPLRAKQVNTTWKPLLFFIRKGDKYKGKIFGDVFKSEASDKSMHKWGQSLSGMLSIISSVCLPGQTIFDPFCGASTTGIAALKHGCLFHGIDINKKAVALSKGRILNDSETE